MKDSVLLFFADCAVSASIVVTPLFAKGLGASDFDLGLIGATYGLALLFSSYVFGWAADVFGRGRLLKVGLAIAVFIFPLHAFSFNPLCLIALRGLAGFCAGMYPPAVAAHAYEARGRLGRLISFGALGWGVGSLLISFIPLYRDVFLICGALFLASFLISLKLEIKDARLDVPLFPRDVIKRGLPVYLSFFLRHMGANAIWAIFPLFLKEIGANDFWIGVTYATNTFTQFLIMPLVDRFKSSRLVACGLAFSTATFLAYSLAENYLQIVPVQLLLACSWSFLYVGALTYVAERGEERATSIGFLGTVRGLAVTIGPFFGGAISQLYGYRSTMIFAVAGSTSGLALFMGYLARRKRFENRATHQP
ncbi:MAG: MFS transporter [Candidatus Freyarchaeota archaeon]